MFLLHLLSRVHLSFDTLDITLDCLNCGFFIMFFTVSLISLRKTLTIFPLSLQLQQITLNAVISKLRPLTTETSKSILSGILMLSLMSAFTAAVFPAANEFGYFNRKNVSLPFNGRLSKNTQSFENRPNLHSFRDHKS